MKKPLIILSFFAIAFFSCKKENIRLAEDNGCITKLVIPATSHGTLPDTDYNLISALFVSNGIVNPNFRFTRTYRDSIQTNNGNYDSRNVYIIQYTNGLPIFMESLNYLFKNGVFNSYSGRLTNGTNINTSPSLSLGQLRKLFIDDISLFDHAGNEYKDRCFNAEFGYYNLNAGTANNSENLVKAWHLTPQHNSYPEAYYQDDSGQRIYYFNGVETFK
ncbi:MAG: hypothetical protein IT249_13785 [Chitinophagaceae bacterium]|nr:hypothetical protein [Chitinophagaceae bacterium]